MYICNYLGISVYVYVTICQGGVPLSHLQRDLQGPRPIFVYCMYIIVITVFVLLLLFLTSCIYVIIIN